MIQLKLYHVINNGSQMMARRGSDESIDKLVEAVLESLRPVLKQFAVSAFEIGLREAERSGDAKAARPRRTTIEGSILKALANSERGLNREAIIRAVQKDQQPGRVKEESVRVTLYKLERAGKIARDEHVFNRWKLGS